MKLSDLFTNEIKQGKLFHIPPCPSNVMLDLTNFCNNNCLYCYNPDDKIFTEQDHDIDHLKRIISLLGKTGTKEILYLGGEPFLLAGIEELLSIGRAEGMFQRATSNGSYLKDPEFCSRLKNSGLNEIGISIHSSKDSIHDRITGRKGSFSEAVLGIENCIRSGISTFIQYSPNMLNSKDDIIALAHMTEKAFGNSIGFFDVNRLIPIGRGEKAQNYFIKDDDWFNFLVLATNILDYHIDLRVELTPFCWLKMKASEHGISDGTLNNIYDANRGCFMWVAQLALDYKGRVKFCPAGPPIGPSILDVIWPQFWSQWNIFQDYRSFNWNKKCINYESGMICKHFYRCLGGCKYSRGKKSYEVDLYSQGLSE